MNLVLLTHPAFLGSYSQSRFAHMLRDLCLARGHAVELRQPQARLRALLPRGPWAKWAGYVDQYLLFPFELVRRARRDPPQTLYVFCDQALGPWVPWLAHRPHVVHCHDLLALRSALGEIAENPTRLAGRLYQRFIRRGFRRARHFISISQQTRDDLHRVGRVSALSSDVVYNGLDESLAPMTREAADSALREAAIALPPGGYLLHVGGGQWYKNTAGVVALYEQVVLQRQQDGRAAPALRVVGPAPDAALQREIAALPSPADVRFLRDVSPLLLRALYANADALLFPSLAEGFGWPIAEALACGCPVVTTGEAPMTEVGGEHALYLPRLAGPNVLKRWAARAAPTLLAWLDRTPAERAAARAAGLAWVRRFDQQRCADEYLRIYSEVLYRDAHAAIQERAA